MRWYIVKLTNGYSDEELEVIVRLNNPKQPREASEALHRMCGGGWFVAEVIGETLVLPKE